MTANRDVSKIEAGNPPRSNTHGILHEASHYDFLMGMAMYGGERAFREKVLRLARLEAGESVLDVGCGTGTLAVAAKRRVGPMGIVCGIDASPEMIARAGKKAEKAGIEVIFKKEIAQSLPFPDAEFEVVLSTLMLHHLPEKARQQCAHEIRRVLKQGGRVLTVDYGESSGKKSSFFLHFHHRYGHVDLREIIAVLSEAGLEIIESGALKIRDLHFVLATKDTGRATEEPKL